MSEKAEPRSRYLSRRAVLGSVGVGLGAALPGCGGLLGEDPSDGERDQIGRKPPIVAGFFLAGAGVFGMMLVDGFLWWTVISGIAGVGMALHYPNLISVASDAAHPLWRSTGLGVYRLWRDLGYAVGAVLIGLSMDLLSIEAAFYGTAIAMFLSGGLVILLMEETHPEFGSHERPSLSREQVHKE